MPVDFSGLFHRSSVDVDFSPIERGGAAMGNAFSGAGESIAAGLIERARIAQEERIQKARLDQDQKQFDAQDATKRMLLEAEAKKDATKARHDALRDFDTNQHRGVMEGQGQARIDLEEKRIGQASSRMRMDALQGFEAQQERRQLAAIQKAHEDAVRGSGLAFIDERLRRGYIDDARAALDKQILDNASLPEVINVIDRHRKEDEEQKATALDDSIRTSAPKDLTKEYAEQRKMEKEAGVKRDPQDDLEVQRAINNLEFSYNKGESLVREVAAVRRMIARGGKSSGGGTKVVLPSGKEVDDTIGFAAGGSVEALKSDPKALAKVRSWIEQSAQGDNRFPKNDGPQMKAALDLMMSGNAPLQANGAAAMKKLVAQQSQLYQETWERLRDQYGWTEGGLEGEPAQGKASPDQAAATDTIGATLQAEMASGAIKTQEDFDRRMAELAGGESPAAAPTAQRPVEPERIFIEKPRRGLAFNPVSAQRAEAVKKLSGIAEKVARSLRGPNPTYLTPNPVRGDRDLEASERASGALEAAIGQFESAYGDMTAAEKAAIQAARTKRK